MKKHLLTLVLLLLGNISFAQSMKPLTGSVTFVVKNTGLNVDGSISGLQGNIDFDMLQPSNSKIIVTIDPATIDTGVGLRDRHLKKEDYFDVDQYQVIKMESTSIVKKSYGYEGVFMLTMKDLTKELVIPFTVKKENSKQHFNASFELDRRDFGVGGNSWVLSDEVKVKVELMIN
ncbi:YceI family protein [Fulvivirga sp.]|uniref:YceI family protein n=1 Tax=Fulvivirga sp. TaxID=1931237 RepID=UPI0032ED9663